MRILVVDDCRDTVETLAILLGLWGHEVRTAYDGAEALAAAADFRPEVVFLDILLPRLNGYQVARQLRQIPGLADVTLIAVTGYAQSDDFAKSQEAGFDRSLVKPVDMDELQRLLELGISARA
jgi:CheY-like chemotaxis protein